MVVQRRTSNTRTTQERSGIGRLRANRVTPSGWLNLGDEGERVWHDAVPLAGARWQVAEGDGDAEFVGQDLQLAFPRPHTRTFYGATTRGDQQFRRGGIAGVAKFVPPTTYGLDGESGGVVVHADTDPPGIGSDIVDAVVHRLAECGDGEFVDTHGFGPALGLQLLSTILEIPDKILRFRVDGDRPLSGGLEVSHGGFDVLKLRVTVGVQSALPALAVGLQAEAQLAEQAVDRLLLGDEPTRRQCLREMALSLVDSTQWSLRITATGGLHSFL